MKKALSEVKIVAVSGGVDSVVLLDMLVRAEKRSKNHIDNHDGQDGNHSQLIVAHFDHGIRPDSADDAQFVEKLATKYGLKFETKREELGPKASEDTARTRRYIFLNSLADKYNGEVVTAHHLDDLVETIAINISRGTGWRGLAPFSSPIKRPLINNTKQELIDYAKINKLDWQEDSTNISNKYLRNRLRTKTIKLPIGTKLELAALHARQKELRHEIDLELSTLLGQDETPNSPDITDKTTTSKMRYSRHRFIQLSDDISLELLREITNQKLTRPQLKRLLHAIKTSRASSIYEAGSGIKVHFTTRYFSL